MSDIDQRIRGSWSDWDHIRHWMYEGIFEGLKRLEFHGPIKLFEFGAKQPTTPVIRMANFLWGSNRVQAEVGDYPAVDIQDSGFYDSVCDLAVADQVMEHVERPWKAAEELRRIVKKGGAIVIATPFLFRVHRAPGDYFRPGSDGYRILFPEKQWEYVEFNSWGNKDLVRREYSDGKLDGIHTWVSVSDAQAILPDFRLANVPDGEYPIVYWLVARKR